MLLLRLLFLENPVYRFACSYNSIHNNLFTNFHLFISMKFWEYPYTLIKDIKNINDSLDEPIVLVREQQYKGKLIRRATRVLLN